MKIIKQKSYFNKKTNSLNHLNKLFLCVAFFFEGENMTEDTEQKRALERVVGLNGIYRNQEGVFTEF